jgi:methyl-accepting chemotaxis protein
VDDLVAAIACASREQNQGVGQINSAMTTIDTSTQSSAAQAEQCAEAATDLNNQAHALQDAVDDLNRLVGQRIRTISAEDNSPVPPPAPGRDRSQAVPRMQNRSAHNGQNLHRPAEPTKAVASGFF